MAGSSDSIVIAPEPVVMVDGAETHGVETTEPTGVVISSIMDNMSNLGDDVEFGDHSTHMVDQWWGPVVLLPLNHVKRTNCCIVATMFDLSRHGTLQREGAFRE